MISFLFAGSYKTLRRAFGIFFISLSMVSAGDATEESASLKSATENYQDVLYLSDQGPIVLRLHIMLDGKGYADVWNNYLDTLFQSLDANSDGVLTDREQNGIPNRNVLSQTGMIRGGSGNTMTLEADANPQDGKVTREELAAYFTRLNAVPFVTQSTVGQPNQNSMNQAQMQGAAQLFDRIDTNGDEKLSAEEFESADYALRKFDLDDDETIGTAELSPLQNPFVFQSRQNAESPQRNESAFISLATGQSTTLLVRQLLGKYDRPQTDEDGAAPTKNYKLSREELQIQEETFTPYDIDEDGELDFDELRQFLETPPPSLEFVIRIGKKNRGEASVELIKQNRPLEEHVHMASDGTANFTLQKTQIAIAADPQSSAQAVDRSALYKAQFQRLDTDNNAYLDSKEVQRFASLRNVFSLVDRDGDEKIFEEEMISYFKNQTAASQSRTILNINDQGRNLFQILDRNRDNRLSRREFLTAIPQIPIWDSDGDGAVANSEFPQQYRMVFSRGNAFSGTMRRVVVNQSVRQPNTPRQSTAGPVWHQKMDLNRDGEVSRREFLGTVEQFQQIDGNSDGLIDMSEAVAIPMDASD